MPHVLVVYNPIAGNKKLANVPEVIKHVIEENSFTYEWFDTVPGNEQPLDRYASGAFDRILVAGGDGTIGQVAHFIVSHNLATPLGIIAQGSGNLLAGALEIPTWSLRRAVTYALLEDAHPIDVMEVNKNHTALIVAGQGYDAVFMRGTPRQLKRKFGIFAYGISFLKTYFSYRAHQYAIEIDGKSITLEAKSVLVINIWQMNGRPVHKDIIPTDGILDIMAINPRSLPDALALLLRILFRRTHVNTPRLQLWQGKHVTIQETNAQHIQMDGNVLSEPTLEVQVKPQVLYIVCPSLQEKK